MDFTSEIRPKNEEIECIYKNILKKGADYSSSILKINKILNERDENKAELYYLRGLCEREKFNFKKAISDFSKSIKTDNKFYLSYFERANIYSGYELDRNDVIKISKIENFFKESMNEGVKKAEEDYKKCIELNPNFFLAYIGLGYLYGNREKSHKKAVLECNKCLKINNECGVGYFFRGWCYSELKMYEKSNEDCLRSLEIKPIFFKAYNNIGHNLTKENKFEEALKFYTKCIDESKKYCKIYKYGYRNRGYCLKELKRYKEAVEDFNIALEGDPQFVDALNDRGICWQNLKEFDKAILDYSKCLEINPTYCYALKNRGWIWRKKKNIDNAINDYKKAIEIRPKYYQAINDLAICYEDRNNYDEAFKLYNKAIYIKPNYKYSLRNRGLLHMRKDEYKKAINDFRRAIKADNKYLYAYNSIGLCYENLLNFKKAIKNYSKCIELDPSSIYGYRNRSECYLKRNLLIRAIKDCIDAKKCDPSFGLLHLIRRIIRRLKLNKNCIIFTDKYYSNDLNMLNFFEELYNKNELEDFFIEHYAKIPNFKNKIEILNKDYINNIYWIRKFITPKKKKIKIKFKMM